MCAAFRSLLFVPGSRPERFDKAVGTPADTIIIDLEDAVLPKDKTSAREAAMGWLASRPPGATAGLRINSPRTVDGCADIVALSQSKAKPDFVMIPKAETGVDVEVVAEALGNNAPVISVIESGRGLLNAYDIACKSNGMLFGGADFSVSLGADLSNWDAMITARATIAAACGQHGVPAYDVPFLDVADEAGLIATTQKVKAFGFTGRACIHPKQVEAVNSVFTPTLDEIDDAKAIILALEDAKGGAVLHKGKLVDRPVILAAERVLAKTDKSKD